MLPNLKSANPKTRHNKRDSLNNYPIDNENKSMSFGNDVSHSFGRKTPSRSNNQHPRQQP